MLGVITMYRIKKLITIVILVVTSCLPLIGKGKMTKADSLLFLSIEMCHSGETFTRSYWESGVADISNSAMSLILTGRFTQMQK